MSNKIIRLNRKRVASHELRITGLLTKHFFVWIVETYEYQAILGETFKAFDIMGKPENVAIADYVFHFLSKTAESLWHDHKRKRKGSSRTSFLTGVIVGFSRKLDAEKPLNNVDVGATADGPAMSPESAKALVLDIKEQVIDLIGRRRYPKTTSSTRRSSFDKRSFAAGAEEGKKIVLSKAIHERGTGQGFALNAGSYSDGPQ
jgi:hypothetical protein